MHETKIEWVFNPDGSRPGFVSNPITGCLNGCTYCYARRLANGRLKPHYLANKQITPAYNYKDEMKVRVGADLSLDPFYPRWWSGELDKLAARKKPAGIFLCDMADWLGGWVPFLWQKEIIDYVKHCTWHRFYLLTKQYHNLARWSPYPDNCYVGFTATTNNQLQYGLAHIAEVEAKIKYISFEPLLERMSFLAAEIVDWIILGALTGSWREIVKASAAYPTHVAMKWGKKWTLQPPVEWLRELVAAADTARIPVFLKNSLEPLLLHQGEPLYWAIDSSGFLRQEMPMSKERLMTKERLSV